MKKFSLILFIPFSILVLAQGQVQDIRKGGGSGAIDYASITNALNYIPVNKAGDTMTGALVLPNTSGALAFTNDVFLQRDAANTLALRNGANPQILTIYNTYSTDSNYERAFARWSGNNFLIGTEKAGAGSSRTTIIDSANTLVFRSSGSSRWYLDTSGNFLANNDNTYDIGASGATRPRNVYIAGFASGDSTRYNYLGIGSASNGAETGHIKSPSDGVIGIYNRAETDFNRLQFGGTSSSFPSLKRSGTSLSVRLADDSADGVLVIPNKTPSSSSETNYVGAISYDADYIYVWTATNVNKRAALTTW